LDIFWFIELDEMNINGSLKKMMIYGSIWLIKNNLNTTMISMPINVAFIYLKQIILFTKYLWNDKKYESK